MLVKGAEAPFPSVNEGTWRLEAEARPQSSHDGAPRVPGIQAKVCLEASSFAEESIDFGRGEGIVKGGPVRALALSSLPEKKVNWFGKGRSLKEHELCWGECFHAALVQRGKKSSGL